MTGLQSGGGTSAVAASAHAGCERFRLTDPFITRVTRKTLAVRLGHPDTSARIPEARWIRAMTFESLVHSERLVAELLNKTIGHLGLARPKVIRGRDCQGTMAVTARELARAHVNANLSGETTMLTALAVPFLNLEEVRDATAIEPDFAIVCPRQVDGTTVGSWLIMGDAKDYERVRSRIDEGRLLKGFLQVALGAESASVWSELPAGMTVHRYGALAVPRDAFLQPEAIVELLDDHRAEVRARAEERLAVRAAYGGDVPTGSALIEHVAHTAATFDPRSCATCNLFDYCRGELRASADPHSLLTEIGVDRLTRPAVVGLVDGTSAVGRAPAGTIAQVTATVSGLPGWTERRRVDPCGLPGTINLVLAKSDSAALGVYGLAVQPVGAGGAGEWVRRSFPDPQSPVTRVAVMGMIGRALREVRAVREGPVHLVIPDRATADLLATAADSLAGVELSRLRWQRDLDMGRPALTFDGEPATIPNPLDADERLAVSFLLEEDRARAMRLRSPIVDLHATLASHLVPGGPDADAGRLDYLVRWALATEPLDHREVSDKIGQEFHTPGARLSPAESDAIHRAQRRGAEGSEAYDDLVLAALAYKISVHETAQAVLASLPASALRPVHRALEGDAQKVWRRRRALQASDLVRFSRTHRPWRNAHVEMLDADAKCFRQLTSLSDCSFARDKAEDPGVRELTLARVIGLDPIRLDVQSRRFGAGTTVVALHINDQVLVEQVSTILQIQNAAFKLGNMPIGRLVKRDGAEGLVWTPKWVPRLYIDDVLILADAAWFWNPPRSGHEITVARPSPDNQAAPKPTCTRESYGHDPERHRWCCRPHTDAEAEWSDSIAQRRARGELNPQTWPPVVDEERFDVEPAEGLENIAPADVPAPENLTLDDLD
ncbi:MAG: hypothetical protein ACRDTE_01600 [Pseudonocardiaceae bacterium]